VTKTLLFGEEKRRLEHVLLLEVDLIRHRGDISLLASRLSDVNNLGRRNNVGALLLVSRNGFGVPADWDRGVSQSEYRYDSSSFRIMACVGLIGFVRIKTVILLTRQGLKHTGSRQFLTFDRMLRKTFA
jgi:hypothetical protein